jgi:hypothetical protein
MLDNPEQPITPEDAASAARDIVSKLLTRWREGGLFLIDLPEALIEADNQRARSYGGGFSSSTTDQANSGRILAERSDKLRVTRRGRLLGRQSGRDALDGRAYLRSGGKQCDVAHLHPNFSVDSIGRCLSNSFNTF